MTTLMAQTRSSGGSKQAEAEALKREFLRCFSVRTNNTSRLREAVKRLIDRGVTRKTLVTWAVQAGYTKGYVSSLLSRILCSMGLRANRVGGGRKPSPDALELLAHSRGRYGKKFLNVLRAAWRAGKAQAATDGSGCTGNLIVAPQVEVLRNNCGTTIKRSRRIARNKLESVLQGDQSLLVKTSVQRG